MTRGRLFGAEIAQGFEMGNLLPVGYARLSADDERVTAEGVSVGDIGRLAAFASRLAGV